MVRSRVKKEMIGYYVNGFVNWDVSEKRGNDEKRVDVILVFLYCYFVFPTYNFL